ncbi:GGDEF domain-containing protein [Hydrogenimonas cancrithermarum]|uniref:diguanylate cyclase n=1 Tax=Hydrogenimonas cancrithermarum TaxID=2993563 RepID=A0ABM8FK96_9BACT|nr:GGDEF domain-containing protein [Hydrogenimonas cancrithermarum]BDY12734.1 hypothetical protein HCR_10460 [Hydrogenimonas cancrithermarum]
MDQAIVKAASQECKSAIDTLEIVTPSIYASIFSEIAKKYGIDPKTLTEVAERSLVMQIEKLLDLNKKSSEQVTHLDKASKKALDAMQAHDETLLRESISETEALRQEIERLKESVYTDSLTKTWNRKWVDANLLDENGHFKKACILAIVDLNYFKQINDTLGHIAGDKVLKYISSHLKSLGIPVVRYGGDEFLLLFDTEESAEKAEKRMHLCRELLLKKTLKFNGHSFKTSFSYGIHACKEGESFSDALEAADKQMYDDKEAIKKRVSAPFS